MFADNHHGDGHVAVWVPAGPDVQGTLIAEASDTYFRPPYVGPAGWVGVELSRVDDDQLGALVREAFRLMPFLHWQPPQSGVETRSRRSRLCGRNGLRSRGHGLGWFTRECPNELRGVRHSRLGQFSSDCTGRSSSRRQRLSLRPETPRAMKPHRTNSLAGPSLLGRKRQLSARKRAPRQFVSSQFGQACRFPEPPLEIKQSTSRKLTHGGNRAGLQLSALYN
jgi:hypothetical protein